MSAKPAEPLALRRLAPSPASAWPFSSAVSMSAMAAAMAVSDACTAQIDEILMRPKGGKLVTCWGEMLQLLKNNKLAWET